MSLTAESVIGRSVVWDNHSCMPLRANDDFLPQLERCRAVGQTAVTLNVGFDLTSVETNLRVLAHFRDFVQRHPDKYLLIKSAEDVLEARRTSRLAVGFDLEGAAALGDQLSMISLYYDLGVRWMLIAYNRANSAGGGCQEEEDQGLTSFGRAMLKEMARVGMVACCSHTGWRTAREVLEVCEGPVIFSHSNAYAVYPHPRNIPDELIRDCAATGGVVGVNGLGRFLGDNSDETWFRHIDHMVGLVGADNVGLGLDYVWDIEEVKDYYRTRPDLFPPDKGYAAPSPSIAPERLPGLVQQMIDHGYSEDAIQKILGLNHLRVARCWR